MPDAPAVTRTRNPRIARSMFSSPGNEANRAIADRSHVGVEDDRAAWTAMALWDYNWHRISPSGAERPLFNEPCTAFSSSRGGVSWIVCRQAVVAVCSRAPEQ